MFGYWLGFDCPVRFSSSAGFVFTIGSRFFIGVRFLDRFGFSRIYFVFLSGFGFDSFFWSYNLVLWAPQPDSVCRSVFGSTIGLDSSTGFGSLVVFGSSICFGSSIEFGFTIGFWFYNLVVLTPQPVSVLQSVLGSPVGVFNSFIGLGYCIYFDPSTNCGFTNGFSSVRSRFVGS